MKHAPKEFTRSDRVASQIRRDLAQLIQKEIKDPRVNQGIISLTAVEVSPDYGYAKVFFSTLNTEDVPQILDGLKRASGFLRRALKRRITLHTLPELHFIHDSSMEYGEQLSRLIKQANELSDSSSPESSPSSESENNE